MKSSLSLGFVLIATSGLAAQPQLPNFAVIKVVDPTGALIPQAEVRVTSPESPGVTAMRTNAQGIARWGASHGRYTVTVQATGFETQTRKLDISGGLLPELSFKLEIGEVGCSPCMLMALPRIEIETAEPKALLLQLPTISPSQPIPTGQAPGMQVKLVSKKGGEKVYAVIFAKGDEVLSGLTDFAIQYKVGAAHFTGIGALSGAEVGWLDLNAKAYQPIEVTEQVEVLSLLGDIATSNGKPVVHAHMVMGKHDGSTVGGHLWQAHVNPTLEVFVSVDPVPLKKKQDDASGMKLIDPKQ